MPFRAGRGPGGIPKFLAQNRLQPAILTTPGYLATAEGENVVRQERVVYSPSATPVFVAPTATPLALAEVAGTIVRRTLVRSLAVFAATSALAEPVYVPVVATTSISSTLASAHSTAVVVTSKVVYDQTAARPTFPPAAAPAPVTVVPDAPQGGRTRSRVKPVQLSAFVFAYPIDDLAADYTDPVVRAIRPRPKLLPDGAIHPPFLPAPSPIAPSIDSKLAGAYGSPTVVLSRVVYDPTSTPVFKPAVATPTPAIWFESYSAARAAPINRDAVKADLDGFQPRLLPPSAITPSYLFETIPPPWTAKPNRAAIKANLDGIERPLADVAPPPTPPPPIPFGSGYSSATVVYSRVVYDQTSAPIFKPAPITPTPATLFDNIGAVTRTLPNGKAIGINLQGFAWSPQDPINLTGSVTVPDTGPGGACRPEPKGPRLPYYRELREKDFFPKSRKKKKYEELLEELQAKADVPAVVVEAVSVLAGKTEAPQIETSTDLAALARLVQAYRVNQRATEQAIAQAQANRVAEAAAEADAEMIAVVLALEEEEMKQIMAIAMLLASED